MPDAAGRVAMQNHVYSAPDAPAPVILLVADDEKTRDLVEAGLRGDGYAVCVTATASEAFARVLDGEDGLAPCIDLVITNLREDHEGALELVVALGGIAAKATVLLMVELFSREHRDVAGVFGVEALDEPFALETLRPAVRAIFDRRGQAQGAVLESGTDWDDEAPTEREVRPSGARVLVADDDDTMRGLVASELAGEGYEVNEAISGAELLRTLESIAVDAWPSDGVDLIVIDLRMPGMSGLEVVRKLRAARWDTPTILMTAFAEPGVIAEAARFGVPVLSKPFTLEKLTRTAGSLLAVHGRANPTDAGHGAGLWS